MVNKKLLLGIVVLVYGLTVIGCDNGTTNHQVDRDTWTNVTSFDQLNGTWKGSNSETVKIQELLGMDDEEWKDGNYDLILGNDAKAILSVEVSFTIDAAAKTIIGDAIITITFTGRRVSIFWLIIRPYIVDIYPGAIIDNSKHSVQITESTDDTLSDEDIEEYLSMGFQINQDETKIKSPAEGLKPEVILYRQ